MPFTNIFAGRMRGASGSSDAVCGLAVSRSRSRLGVLAGSFWLRSLLSDVQGRPLGQGLGEGLLILGWVAMWRPVEILLFEHWESHLDHAMLERLASVPIEFVFQPDASEET